MKGKLVFLLLMGMKWRFVYSTCVFESDFGFTVNCGFKKSSILRVRNLGGVKSYFGLGFSLGDELGFKQSLSNLDGSNRRSVNSARSAAGYFAPLLTTTGKPETQNTLTGSNNRSSHAINLRTAASRHSMPIMTLPPFRPIHPGDKLVRPTRITKVEEEGLVTLVAVPAFAALPQSIAKVPTYSKASQNPHVSLDLLQTNPLNNRRVSYNALFGREPEVSNSISTLRVVPTPASIALLSDPLLPEVVGNALKNVAQATNISADALLASIQLRQQQMLYQQQKQLAALAAAASSTTTQTPTNPWTTPGTISTEATPTDSVKTPTSSVTPAPVPVRSTMHTSQVSPMLSHAGVASSFDYSAPAPSRIATKTSPKQKYQLTGIHKVMNAPKEYYPVNYDKNFDDNFTSRVELPDTSFSCGDQKHFPGLYADEDLSCMVFHVCALTDDGLIMKSFLCPESTLFDQTILKCNWWFYVDCKASKKLYDSNIPLSKSYQLMKALTFFSSYNKNDKNSSR